MSACTTSLTSAHARSSEKAQHGASAHCRREMQAHKSKQHAWGCAPSHQAMHLLRGSPPGPWTGVPVGAAALRAHPPGGASPGGTSRGRCCSAAGRARRSRAPPGPPRRTRAPVNQDPASTPPGNRFFCSKQGLRPSPRPAVNVLGMRWRQRPAHFVHSALAQPLTISKACKHSKILRSRTSSASLPPPAPGNQLSRTVCAFLARAAAARRPMLTHTPRAARRGVHGRYTGPGESHLQVFKRFLTGSWACLGMYS